MPARRASALTTNSLHFPAWCGRKLAFRAVSHQHLHGTLREGGTGHSFEADLRPLRNLGPGLGSRATEQSGAALSPVTTSCRGVNG